MQFSGCPCGCVGGFLTPRKFCAAPLLLSRLIPSGPIPPVPPPTHRGGGKGKAPAQLLTVGAVPVNLDLETRRWQEEHV
jgi:hypothetical protein